MKDRTQAYVSMHDLYIQNIAQYSGLFLRKSSWSTILSKIQFSSNGKVIIYNMGTVDHQSYSYVLEFLRKCYILFIYYFLSHIKFNYTLALLHKDRFGLTRVTKLGVWCHSDTL